MDRFKFEALKLAKRMKCMVHYHPTRRNPSRVHIECDGHSIVLGMDKKKYVMATDFRGWPLWFKTEGGHRAFNSLLYKALMGVDIGEHIKR